MSVDDHGIEALRKGAEEFPPGQQAEYRHKVRVTNASDDPIPVVFTEGGVPVFLDSDPSVVSEEDSWVDVLVSTVPAGVERRIQTFIATCRLEGVFQILVDDVRVLHSRTSAASPTVSIQLNPARPIAAQSEIKVQFRARQGSPISDVGAHLMGSDFTI